MTKVAWNTFFGKTSLVDKAAPKYFIHRMHPIFKVYKSTTVRGLRVSFYLLFT